MCRELLKFYKINFNLVHAPDVRGWWHANHHRYDKCFNLCAAGHINVPPQSFHWQPCKDEGVKLPFNPKAYDKKYELCVQVNGGPLGGSKMRHFAKRPVLQYIDKIFTGDRNRVIWVGTDSFDPPFGNSYSKETSLEEAMNLIAQSERFIGFNSVLLYWALHNKIESHLFMDHQGKHDIRIHDQWKQYLHYLE